MFRHEGPEREHHHNQALAAYLALVAGFVNSAGFVLVGTFTSHVTGNVGRFADDLALGGDAAVFAALMVVAYFAGAFWASVAIESDVVRHRPWTYGGLLIVEAALLVVFIALSGAFASPTARVHDIEAMLLCAAMGMQNSLVTRLSGAVVRTTHLTGVVTDLGIEAARWFRYWRKRLGERTHVRLVAGSAQAIAPHGPKTRLLLTILGAFVVGGMGGALAAHAWDRRALALPIGALLIGGAFALRARPTLDRARA